MPDKSPDEWGSLYAADRSRYEDLCARLERLVVDLLISEAIDVVQVESRTKTVASFIEKLKVKGKSSGDAFEAITDLVGIRIITYYLEDVAKVGELIRREFAVDEVNSLDKAAALASDQFGYRSTHFVVRLGSMRANLGEWKRFGDIAIEVQVRTALQHAWAAVSHKLDYKSSEEVPVSLRRQLFRLSALFELADEQFSSLQKAHTETDQAYRVDVGKGRLDVTLDRSSLAAYESLSPHAQAFQSLIASEGFETEGEIVDAERRARDRVDLLKVLKHYKFTSLQDLDDYLGQNAERLSALVEAAVSALSEADSEANALSLDDALTQVILLDKRADKALITDIYTENMYSALWRAMEQLDGAEA